MLSEFLQDFPVDSIQYIGVSSIRKAKDAFCSLVLKNNRAAVAGLAAANEGSILMVHVHDEMVALTALQAEGCISHFKPSAGNPNNPSSQGPLHKTGKLQPQPQVGQKMKPRILT